MVIAVGGFVAIVVSREAVQKFIKRGVDVNYNTDRPKYMQCSLSGRSLIDRL